jgi:glycosyltransferase involved in cell wall biosynthesis
MEASTAQRGFCEDEERGYKVSSGNCCVRSFYKGHTSEQEIHRLQALPKAPAILYLDDDLPTDQLPGLYTACDCLVHPYRGEGFGLPIAEAMACGLPVIITNHGAALDFCAAETAYLIPAIEKRLPDRRLGYLETVDHPWVAEPDADALARLMRHVYEHHEEAHALGARASARIRTTFTWEHGAQRALARLQALRGRPIRRGTVN